MRKKQEPEKKFVKVTPRNTKNLDYTVKYKKDFQITCGEKGMLFLLLVLNDLKPIYRIEIEDFLKLLYLYELGVFPIMVDIGDKHSFRLTDYVGKRFIERDYEASDKKEWYKLTVLGYEIVEKIFDRLNDLNQYKYRNREALMSVDNQAEHLIRRYFS